MSCYAPLLMTCLDHRYHQNPTPQAHPATLTKCSVIRSLCTILPCPEDSDLERYGHPYAAGVRPHIIVPERAMVFFERLTHGVRPGLEMTVGQEHVVMRIVGLRVAVETSM